MRINAEALTKLREEAGHTQASLGRESDVGQSYISALERGERSEVRPPTAKRLAEALGCGVRDITLRDPADQKVS